MKILMTTLFFLSFHAFAYDIEDLRKIEQQQEVGQKKEDLLLEQQGKKTDAEQGYGHQGVATKRVYETQEHSQRKVSQGSGQQGGNPANGTQGLESYAQQLAVQRMINAKIGNQQGVGQGVSPQMNTTVPPPGVGRQGSGSQQPIQYPVNYTHGADIQTNTSATPLEDGTQNTNAQPVEYPVDYRQGTGQ